ncbi:MAG: 2-oxoacid:ferredoxin oxidoreductase subunit beta [Nitrososphaeraceae archaeon]
MASNPSDYKTTVHNDWCPGCGDFGILNAIQMALSELQLPRHNVSIFSGIGCSGKTPHFIHTYGIHTLHGRVLPFAQGAKLCNPELNVIAVGGDGDGLGIGVGHFVNAGRRNIDVTYIIFNNGVYGLTKGQASPTLKLGMKTKSLTQPNVNNAINPITLAFVSGFTFIARGYAYDIKHLKNLIQEAVKHKGLSFLDILQPCPTYNDINTKQWFQGLDNINTDTGKIIPRIYKLENTEYNGILQNEEDYFKIATQVMEKANEWNDKIPIGVFYKNDHIPAYQTRINSEIKNYIKYNPSKQQIKNDEDLTYSSIDHIIDTLIVNKDIVN